MQVSKERLFLLINVVIFSVVPLLTYKKPENMKWWHFLLAFSVIFLVFGFLWKKAGEFQFSIRSLVLIQIGFLLHYMGTMHFGGIRGYNLIVVDNIRFDKFIHFFNSMISFIVLNDWSKKYNLLEVKNKNFWMILIVLGLGAVIEIIEYVGIQFVGTIAIQGPYDNNLQDLIADLMGAIVAALF
ncbi:MAG: hypothetical protein WCO84_04430 [bacterium]